MSSLSLASSKFLYFWSFTTISALDFWHYLVELDIFPSFKFLAVNFENVVKFQTWILSKFELVKNSSSSQLDTKNLTHTWPKTRPKIRPKIRCKIRPKIRPGIRPKIRCKIRRKIRPKIRPESDQKSDLKSGLKSDLKSDLKSGKNQC